MAGSRDVLFSVDWIFFVLTSGGGRGEGFVTGASKTFPSARIANFTVEKNTRSNKFQDSKSLTISLDKNKIHIKLKRKKAALVCR